IRFISWAGHMSHEPSLKRFHVFLIKPSKYDDEGYVIRWARAVLVSHSLAVLNALTEDAARSRILGPEVEILPHVLDETVTQIRVKEIAASLGRAGDNCVFCRFC